MAYQVSNLMADVIALVEQRWVSSDEIWKVANAMAVSYTHLTLPTTR